MQDKQSELKYVKYLNNEMVGKLSTVIRLSHLELQ